MKNTKYEIVIVGGGIVGLLTSISLSKQGFQILHIERDSLEVKNDTRSLALSYSSVAVLNTLGLWSKVKQDCQYIKGVHVSDKGHYGRAELSAELENLPFLGVIANMKTLLKVCLDELAECDNITKSFSTSVSKIHKSDNGYTLETISGKGKENITTDLIIACDGANSFIRKSIDVGADIKDYKQNAIVFDIKATKKHNGIAYERFVNDGVLAFLPKLDNIMAGVWTVDRDKSEAVLKLSDLDFREMLQDKFGYRLGQLELVSKRASFPLYLVQSQQVYKDNVLFFGNALHFLHPVSGQGLNLSIRDIGCLYDLLQNIDISDKSKLEECLRQFVNSRKSDHDRTIKVTNSFIQLFVSDNFLSRRFRNVGLHLLQRSDVAKKIFSKLMMGKFSKNSSLMRKAVE